MCLVNSNFVYVTGGFSGIEVFANCHRYEIDRDQWVKMLTMDKARYLHSSCQLAGYIYVFCGINRDGLINTVEKLSVDTKSKIRRW